MKQHITGEQWDELSGEQKKTLYREMFGFTDEEMTEEVTYGGKTYIRYNYANPNIGQMIEFLGDDWHKGIFFIEQDFGNGEHIEQISHGNGALCNALWEEVKSKLNA